ncbi:MAG: tRNA pseudouridine(55) synthase TruB [Cytophagaceae bacterium]
MAFDFENGEVLLIDKPLEWTSFDVVKKIRNTIKLKKIGHAGTLDPLATGLLILCTGKFTKRIDFYQSEEKEYTGKMVIGQTTPSFDLETAVDSTTDISQITSAQIREKSLPFIGIQEQIPPIYSAVKINGERSYNKARRGEDVVMKSREVHIKEFEITDINLPEISFRLVCSKGTYVRSLVRDFGISLGVGAYMSELRRTRIGEFTVGNAYSLEGFLKAARNEDIS